jgi:uncharacterized membrane protein
MATFTVWKFEDPDGAEAAAEILKDEETDKLVKILDYAVVSWPPDASKPKMKHGKSDAHREAGWGALWGLVVGTIFFIPVLGAAAGIGMGALHHVTKGVGIDKDAIETMRKEIVPGTSALMVMTDEGNLDRIGERFHGMHMKLVDSNLTSGERQVLLETFDS